MNDSKPAGSAAAALGAHSKDGSESGQPGPASASGGAQHGPRDTESHADMSHQARERIERMASTVRDAAGAARETVATQGGRAMEETGRVVREQPLMALAVTGLVCLAVGVMLGRR